MLHVLRLPVLLPEALVKLDSSDVFETLNSIVKRFTVFVHAKKELDHMELKEKRLTGISMG